MPARSVVAPEDRRVAGGDEDHPRYAAIERMELSTNHDGDGAVERRAGAHFDVGARHQAEIGEVAQALGLLLADAGDLTLAADRQIPAQTADLQAGHWRHGQYSTASGLAGRTLGIIGLGPVGQEVARRGLAFGMHVIAWSRHITEARCDALGIDLCANLVNLAKLSDVVSVNVPQSAETADMVGEKFFAAMRPGAILVNTSRSGAIDEAALLRAVLERLRPRGVVVIPLATLEALAELRPLLEGGGLAVSVSQHQSWRGAPLGEGTRLAPLNPVLVLTGRCP